MGEISSKPLAAPGGRFLLVPVSSSPAAKPPSPPPERIRIGVVEDEMMIRQMLAMCLNQHSSFELVGQAANVPEARQMILTQSPHALILDLGLGGQSGLSFAVEALEKIPDLRILAVTATHDGSAVRNALDLGVTGFVSKGESFEVLQTALDHLAQGRAYYSPSALKLLRNNLSTPPPAFEQLTPRERDVLRESALGLSVKEIGTKLSISENTVKTHRKNVLQKLDLHDVVALTHYAVRHGLVSLA